MEPRQSYGIQRIAGQPGSAATRLASSRPAILVDSAANSITFMSGLRIAPFSLQVSALIVKSRLVPDVRDLVPQVLGTSWRRVTMYASSFHSRRSVMATVIRPTTAAVFIDRREAEQALD